MREILFRGKRTDNGEWVDGHLCKDGFGKMYIIHYVPTKYNNVLPERKVICVDPETVGQSTGRTDKNGNKIWENDILSEDWGDYKGIVRFGEFESSTLKNLGFNIEWSEEAYYRQDFMYWVRKEMVEVIGNIFDNPELMEGGVADE